jgi:hypothetical protein
MRQRYFETAKENRVALHKERHAKKLIGRVRLLAIALNYEGTDAPLNCTVDARRIAEAAQKAGVKDVTALHDTGDTDGYPSSDEVSQAIAAVGGRCKPHDYFVLYYSGHGGSEPNPDAPTGVDCTLCLRKRDGSDDAMVDDRLAALVVEHVDEGAKVLMLCDACHSGGIMDIDSGSVWGKRKVAVISGVAMQSLSPCGRARPLWACLPTLVARDPPCRAPQCQEQHALPTVVARSSARVLASVRRTSARSTAATAA